MPPTRLHQLYDEQGQSPWIDNLTRTGIRSGHLQQLVESGIRGVTSNPTIFQKAIAGSADYDEQFAELLERHPVEEAYWELVLRDITDALDVMRSVYDASAGTDGFVSLEVAPALAHDTAASADAARAFAERIARPNLMVKIPGTAEGLPAIEEAIFAGVPVNVTLLFSREQYVAAAEAYLRGVERRIAAGLNPAVASVASLFISRWDVAVAGKVPAELTNRLGIAVGQRTYKAYLELLASPRFQRVANSGARAQRLLWASTGTKDPKASDALYVKALAAPFTINTMPEGTLKAFADHGEVGEALASNGGDCETVLASFAKAGIDTAALAKRLQDEGAASFVKSWNDLMERIDSKRVQIRKAS